MSPTPSADRTRTDRARVIAHRGASGVEPESTRLAVERAIALGADAIEVDIQASADGQLFIHHDCTLDRTTDAAAVFGREGLRTCDLTGDQLRRLDISAWFDPALPRQRMLTLAELVELVDGRADFLIEVSPCEHYADTDLAGEVARELTRLLPDRSGLAVQSFRIGACERLRELLPDVPVGWLCGPDERFTQVLDDDTALGRLVQTVDQVNPRSWMADRDLLERLHAYGVSVHAWIVNEPDEIAALIDAGIDGLITDYPDRVLAAG